MKFLSYMTIFALVAQFASAQSISDQELQERFNKAFSVFNQQSSAAEDELASMANQNKAKDKQEKTLEFNKGEKNVVKTSNHKAITSQPQEMRTQELNIPSTTRMQLNPAKDFISLQDRPILIDMQNANLKQIVQEALNQVAFDDQWTIKWRLKDENKYILNERMNLTAEVNFDSFVGNMLETITNITGIRLTTKVFNKNKIIIITDSF